MIRLSLVVAVALASGSAWAATSMFHRDGRLNVEGVRKCATKPYPAPGTEEGSFYAIEICRLMLLSRHAGWIEANPGKPDPVPPVEMSQPGDLKPANAPSR